MECELLVAGRFRALVKADHRMEPIQLDIQLCLADRAVPVDHQSQRQIGHRLIADNLDVPAAVELALIFHERANEVDVSHVRIVQPPFTKQWLTHDPERVTLCLHAH